MRLPRRHPVRTAIIGAVSALMVAYIAIVAPTAAYAATYTAKIDPGARYQTIEGWGTSLAWFGNVLGGWTGPGRTEVADRLFSSSGLGLNIVRYNVGAGGPGRAPLATDRVGGEVPTFEPANDVWDWTADANQRWFVTAAKDRGANLFEAFSNSPPVWMLDNGCTHGANSGTSNNLGTGYYDDFASHLAGVTQHFRDSWGVTFRTVTPVNEPNANWWQCSNNQEGSHFDQASQAAIMDQLASALNSSGQYQTVVSGPEENTIAASRDSYNSYGTAVQAKVGQINAHSYGSQDGVDGLRRLSERDGKRLWVSEFGTGSTTLHDHADNVSALDLAARIRGNLNDLRASGWVYWQAVEDEAGDNTWGLIHANFTGAESYWLTKQYYAFANYTKFIKPGYQIIGSDDQSAVTAYSPDNQTLVIVADNQTTSANTVTYDLSGFAGVGSVATPYRTSATENLVTQSTIGVSGKQFTATLPAKSVTTFVVTGATYTDPATNVLGNPGFESGSMSPWAGTVNASLTGVETSYRHSGAYDAYLHPTASLPTELSQTITAPTTGRYTLSGYAATNRLNGVKLGVNVAGATVTQAPVTGNVGYWPYTVTFDATAGQSIKVSYSATAGAGWATLDDLSLTAAANLLGNSSFETGSLSPWAGEWNPSLAGVETSFPNRGSYDAYLHPTSTQDVAAYQTITAPATGTYTLSADAATNLTGSTVRLGVNVAGSQVGQRVITGGGTYHRYSITFNATAGQAIKVWYYSGKVSGWATLDTALLRRS